jgi:hypothetical protein
MLEEFKKNFDILKNEFHQEIKDFKKIESLNI